MNSSKLPKEKRNQLILVALVAVIALGSLGFGLMQWQYGKLRSLTEACEVKEKERERVVDAINRAAQIEADYRAKNKLLAEQEQAMASGDLYSWLVNMIQTFKLPYQVDIPSISQPSPPSDVDLLPKYRYKQVTVKVTGTGYFHDIGQFITDFENHFPHVRIVNLTLEPPIGLGENLGATDKDTVDKEKLSFTMDIVTLVKPSNS